MNLDSIIHSSSPHPRASDLLRGHAATRNLTSVDVEHTQVRPCQNGPLPILTDEDTFSHSHSSQSHSSQSSDASISTVSSPVSDDSYSSHSYTVTFHPGQRLAEKSSSKASKKSRSLVEADVSIEASTIEKGSRKRRASFPADTSGMSAAEIKRERRKQQNRDAAATSRMKKKMYVETMNSRISSLSEATQKLQLKLQQLAEENSQLKKLLKAKQEEIYGKDGSEIPADPLEHSQYGVAVEEFTVRPNLLDDSASQQHVELSTPIPSNTRLTSNSDEAISQSSSPYDDSQHTSPVQQWYSSGSDGEEVIIRQNEVFVTSPQSSETSYSSHDESIHDQLPVIINPATSLEPLRVTTVSSVHTEAHPASYVAATPVPLPSPSVRSMDTRHTAHTYSYPTTHSYSHSTPNTYEHVVSSSSSSLSSSSSSSQLVSTSSTDDMSNDMITPSSTNVHTANMQYSMPCSGLCMKVQELIIMLVMNQMNMMMLPWNMYMLIINNMMMVNTMNHNNNSNSNKSMNHILMTLYQMNNLNSSTMTVSTSLPELNKPLTTISKCHITNSALQDEHAIWRRAGMTLQT